jgi:hypothetical protein
MERERFFYKQINCKIYISMYDRLENISKNVNNILKLRLLKKKK